MTTILRYNIHWKMRNYFKNMREHFLKETFKKATA